MGHLVLALDALFQTWLPNPSTKSNPECWCHGGATEGMNSHSAGTGTLTHPNAGTGKVPGWAMAYTRNLAMPQFLQGNRQISGMSTTQESVESPKVLVP